MLMGFHQNQISMQVIFLQTELKPKFEPDSLSKDSEDIYLQTKLETYLKRHSQLDSLTYPEFYQWWHSVTPDEQKKAAQALSSMLSNAREVISRDTWMPRVPWNQLRHSLLIY